MSAKLLDRFVEVMLGKVRGDARSEALLRHLVRAHDSLTQDPASFFLHAVTTRGRPVAKAIADFGV